MLSEKLNKAMFNGRTLNEKFRRGWWKVSDAVLVEGCPEQIKELNTDAKILWYNGCLAVVCSDGVITLNKYTSDADIIKELSDELKKRNPDAEIKTDDLGKAMRGGSRRDLDDELAF